MLEHATWLAADAALQNPFIRTELELEAFECVEIDVCGLGFFELYVNGVRADEHYFKPVWTDYRKRDLSTLLYPISEEFRHRICVLRCDLTRFLHLGKNSICFLLANGWYRQDRRNIEGDNRYGSELLICYEGRIRTAKGMQSFVSREGRACEGFVVENNVYYGETQDYAKLPAELGGNFCGEEFPLRPVSPPEAEIELQDCPNDSVIRTLEPALIRDFGDRRIFDAGENLTGWAEPVSEGGEVCVRYAEELDAACELDFLSAGGTDQIQTHVYRNAPAGTSLSPLFSWCAFRFFEVRGARKVSVKVVHADVKVVSKFRSESANLNWLFSSFVRTQLNNMHAGVPSDCPHRERLGYTGDGQLAAGTALLLLDCRKFYEKWMRDVADCQDLATGHVQHTAPFYGGGGGPGGWGCAVAVLPYRIYERYGDLSVFQKYRENILRWLNCMADFCRDGLVVRELEGGWCLGDWCTPEPLTIPEPLVNTYYYILSMEYFDRLEGLCGGVSRFETEISRSKGGVERAFGTLRGQGTEAFLTSLGIGGNQLLEELSARYRALGRFDTGIFGTDVLCRVLARHDRELLFDLLDSEKFGSFGYMRGRGATTLWENWSGEWSHNHPMFGAAAQALFTGVLGISVDHEAGKITVAPLKSRGRLRGALEIAGGLLCAEWNGCELRTEYDGKYRIVTK